MKVSKQPTSVIEGIFSKEEKAKSFLEIAHMGTKEGHDNFQNPLPKIR